MVSLDAAELRGSPDQGKLIPVNPTELMQGNPAALVVNIESYRNMGAYFSPDRLDPPQIAWVLTYTPEHGEVAKPFILDGMTRTKYFADHAGETLSDYPGFTFDVLQVRDVTESTIRNPRFVPENERKRGQRALTIQQYLRAVVPPTAEHSAIAADRIAAHLINGWETIVGHELARRFSALAALSFTTQGAINQYAMEARLRDHGRLVVDEKPEEREKIENGLLDMTQIIEVAGLGFRKNSVVQAALILTGAESPAIGGERESWRQVYGLLYSPKVQNKLEIATEEFGEQENLRVDLARSIMQALKTSAGQPNAEQVRKLVGEVLADVELAFSDMINVFSSPTPVERNNELHISLNRSKLEDEYLSAKQSGGIGDIESQLLVQLGSVRYLEPSKISTIVRAVREANRKVIQVKQFIARVSAQQEELVQQGVNPDVIETGLQRLDELQNAVLTANSSKAASGRTEELAKYLTDIEAKIERQINLYKAEKIVREIFGDETESVDELRYRGNIAFYFSGDIGNSTEEDVRHKVARFRALDSDLQLRVLTGQGGILRFERALEIQETRNKESVVVEVELPEGLVTQDSVTFRTRVPKRSAETAVAASQLKDEKVASSGEEEQGSFHDRDTQQRKRRDENNVLLARISQVVREQIENLDLQTHEINPATHEALRKLFEAIGVKAFGQPDAARIVFDYQERVRRDIASNEGQLILEQEINLRETRTDR